jgi:predicted Co/Zn/Cd cation transporter (cation efflux family)
VGLALAPGVAKAGFALALCAIALLYARMGRQFVVPFRYVFTHPVAALMFVYTLLNSAVSSLVHGGVMWRGTTYSIAEIRLATAESRRKGSNRG